MSELENHKEEKFQIDLMVRILFMQRAPNCFFTKLFMRNLTLFFSVFW
jgi:hypothetical protein